MPISQTGGLECDTVCIGGCLEPGSYFLLVQPSGPAGSVNCANGDYTVSLDCQPCIPCPVCDPVSSTPEGEACPNFPDLYNGGCAGGIEYTRPIQCGEDVCGDSWSVQIPPSPYYQHDRDVYELVLTDYDSVVFSVFSNVPASVTIAEPLPGCAGLVVWGSSFQQPKCDTAIAGACLPPGRYWFIIQTNNLPGYCEPYTASLRCYPCSLCVECPLTGTARPEGEPCPNFNDQYNAGCHSTPPTATHVQCGDTVCGSATYYDIPDHDFYELTITTRDTVTWCVEAEFPVAAAIMTPNANCSSMIIHAQGNAPACMQLCLSVCLDPGTYWLYVRPTASFGFLNPIHCKPYVASVHCAPCPTGQTCTYADFDFDPANNGCSFTNIQLSCNDTICGEIIPGAAPDQDWYTFEIPFGTPCVLVTANVYGNDTPGYFPFSQGLDPGIAIYEADCTTLVGQDNNSGVGNDALLATACLPSGWYHIRVGGFQGSVGPYVLSLNCTPCACPPPCNYQNRDIEPANNNCATAPAEFICGDTLCGETRQGPTPDIDWYLFFVFGPNCQQLTVDVFGNGTPGYYGYLAGLDPIVELWDGTCTTQLALDDNSGLANDSRLVSACLQPGTYRLKITGVGGTFGPYVFAADCQDCSCSGQCPYLDMDFDPANNVCGPGTMLFCSDTLCGEIIQTQPGQPFDVDWYQVTIPPTGCYSLTVDAFANSTPAYSPFGGGLDPFLQLYANDCSTIIEFDYDSGIGTDSKLTSGCLSPGVYNLKIQSPSGSSGPYILAIACAPCHCPCSLACSPNLPQEGEPCPNPFGPAFNEGCNTNPPTFTPINCNTGWCGESWAMGGYRDTDWYELNLTAPRRIRWRLSAEFPFEMAIYQPTPNCGTLTQLRYATGYACQSREVIIKCLAAGTYYFYVAPTVYTGVPCSSDYTTRLQCGKCLIGHVVIHHVATDIQLFWDPDDTEPVYTVHRSTVPEFEPTDQTIIGTTTEPFYTDQNVIQTGAERYFYVVTMYSPEVEDR